MIRRSNVFAAIGLSALILAASVVASDDPFAGTWRETEQLKISPRGDGWSVEPGGNGRLDVTFGKDYNIGEGVTGNSVRVDDHTVLTTRSQDGKVYSKTTETVSPDGRRYTTIVELEGLQMPVNNKITIEYERVGSVPEGDVFIGTWNKISPLDTLVIAVDGQAVSISTNGRTDFDGNLDGKESNRSSYSVQAKRTDAQTMEILTRRLDSEVYARSFHLSGDDLVETDTWGSPESGASKTVAYYERIK